MVLLQAGARCPGATSTTSGRQMMLLSCRPLPHRPSGAFPALTSVRGSSRGGARAASSSEVVASDEQQAPNNATAEAESNVVSAPKVWRPPADDKAIARALSSNTRPRRRPWSRLAYRLDASSTLLEEDFEPADVGGRQEKASMLFASASQHRRASPSVSSADGSGEIDWGSDEMSGEHGTGNKPSSCRSSPQDSPDAAAADPRVPSDPGQEPGAEGQRGGEGEEEEEEEASPTNALFSARLSGVTEEEATWRGVRDSICFTLIVMAAGGPVGASQLLGDGLAAAGLALKQAHTHPQIIFFTSSLVPYLAFLLELWRCGRETRGVALAFGSLLIFVVAGIPLESYTESEYGDLLSNVDSVHFAAQSLVSSTNLAILLAFQDASATALRVSGASAGVRGAAAAAAAIAEGSSAAQVPPAGLRADASLLSALLGTSLAGAWALKQAGSQLVLHPASAAALVGDNDLYPLLCVLLPTAMGAGCLGLAAKGSSSASSSASAAAAAPHRAPSVLSGVTLQQSLWTATLLLGTAAVLAPWGGAEYVPEPSNALSVPTWSVHVLSIMEWSVAMAVVWQYGDLVRRPEWRGLAWAMLPLHGSGLCAVVFHLWYNDPSLDWLISLQAFLTLVGNSTCWWAARRIRIASSSSSSS